MADKIIKWNDKLLTYNKSYIRSTIIPVTPSGPPSDYVGAWFMEDNWNDQSANDYNLSATGSPTFSTGKVGKCGTFDGSNYAKISSIGDMSTWDGLTISLWTKFTTLDKDFSWYGSGWHNGTTSGAGGGIYCNFFMNGEWKVLAGYATINDDAWHHAVITWASSDSTGVVWIDNVKKTATQNTGMTGPLSAGTDFTIGGTGAAGSWIGDVDQFYVYNRRLTDDEIGRLWNNGDGA